MWKRGTVAGLRAGPGGTEVLRVHAVSRIVLDRAIPNLQVSWVKEGPRVAQLLLGAGANDLGGTLINESISTSAGAAWGQLVPPREMRRLIRGAGRVPAERLTTYRIRRRFGASADDDAPDALDLAAADAARFGSYRQLIKMDRFRYHHPGRADAAPQEAAR